MKIDKVIFICSLFLLIDSSCQTKMEKKVEKVEPVIEPISQIEPIINDIVINEMSQAYGFKIGQDYSLEMIKNEYPSLVPQIQLAKLKFAKSFESSLETIDSILLSKGNEWIKIKNQIKEKIKSSFNLKNYNYNQILDFISTVESRANGEISAPIIGTLLTFNPRYLKNPTLEFTDGFKFRFNSKGNEKAKGLEFHLDLPQSWLAKEANRPNIVQKFVSQNGNGLEMIMVLVKSTPDLKNITEEKVKEIASKEEARDMLPEDAQFINSEYIRIDNLSGYYLEYKISQMQLDQELLMYTAAYNVYYKDYMISVQCLVGSTKDAAKNIDSVFMKYKELFKLVACSLVVQDQWK